MSRRLFELLLAHRWLSLATLLAMTAASLVLAALYVRPDFSVEYLFPEHDRSRVVYDRYKHDFPYEPSRALVIVEAPDLFTSEGLARIQALETDLANLEGVIDTDGLTTVQDVVSYEVGDGEQGIRTERVFPRTDLEPAEIARKRATVTTDPLFQWTLCPPDGRATTIRVNLERAYAEKDGSRMQFLFDAREVVARHHVEGQTIVLSGLPVIRAEFTELISLDMVTLMPLSLAMTLVLLYLSFRSATPILAALLTILGSVSWTFGACALLGYPLQLLTQITPIVCMIVSISDTVHIVAHYQGGLAKGLPRPRAIVDACVDSAGPCLLTEVVIAFGFLGLLFQDVLLISQFGALTAAGMILTWTANVTVLPLALSFLRPGDQAAQRSSTPITRTLRRFLTWIDMVSQRWPGRVTAAAAVILGLSVCLGANVGKEYYAYGNLYPSSQLYQDIRYADDTHGGSVPFAVYIEPRTRNVLLVEKDPEVAHAVEATLRQSPLRFDLVTVAGAEEALRYVRGQDQSADAPSPDAIVMSLTQPGQVLADLASSFGLEERSMDAPIVAVVPEGAAETSTTEQQLLEDHGVVSVFRLGEGADRERFQGVLRSGEPMLHPDAVRLMDRVATYLEDKFKEMKQASSAADYWRKVHRLWVDEEEAARDPFPATVGGVTQELELIDRTLLRDFLAPDRATASVFGMVPDLGSSRSTDLIQELGRYLAEEEQATGYRLHTTGAFAICDGIYRTMVVGLAASLGFALVISLAVFTIVLRSWRLGLIALVPNVLPLLLTLGIMAVLGIDLKPTTVICFSITLVIADDDTIQFLVRFRRRFLKRQEEGETNLHGAVASDTIADSGLPMFLTACAVSLGFLSLMFSQFIGLRNLGLLIGVSLFSAVFADLFLSPIMLRYFRPKIGGPERAD
ncbi:MMPL family transporter [Planctomycetota bacterium]